MVEGGIGLGQRIIFFTGEVKDGVAVEKEGIIMEIEEWGKDRVIYHAKDDQKGFGLLVPREWCKEGGWGSWLWFWIRRLFGQTRETNMREGQEVVAEATTVTGEEDSAV